MTTRPTRPIRPIRSARGLSGGLFVGIGAEDRQQPVSAHQPFLDVISTFDHAEVKIYAEADHGYTWQDWPSYNPAAANDSFAKTIALFGASLRPMSA